ncbi:uncharacterized protein LOC109711064 isoform X1 [Ananas comosus]|uniref:Uncharacterized protein LOC109711064 isoform X1 n=1 Tax=Ananas comosus TaxID=4615 RepID=A0A6P5F095_ANACO|nr:uncharacterized protein LOC109711064 isoform X1 [Ananas comosus]
MFRDNSLFIFIVSLIILEFRDTIIPWCTTFLDDHHHMETLVPTNLSFARGVPKPQENCYSVEKERQKGAPTWSEALEEANKLACLRNTLSRRGRGRAKPKFSIHTHSCESSPSRFKDKNDKCYEGSSRRHISHPTMSEHPRPEMFENVDEEIDEHPLESVTAEMRGALPSMAEMLEDLQEKNGISNRSLSLLLHNVKMKEKKTTSFGRTIVLNLGDRDIDDDDPLEYVDGEASAEDEVILNIDVDQQDLNLASQKIRGQTMTDLFQDAFTASALEEPMVQAAKFSGAGYYGRLQRVMQIEKDRHLEFLKQSRGGQSSSNDFRGFTVQILSRCLEGKLTVCHCSFEEDTEYSSGVKGPIECVVDGGTVKRTVIFSSKICGNVDIEVGKFIRMYPPWKEVLVKEDEKIILCTYFSNVMA